MIDLSSYTPSAQSQYESTCYSYAVAYTAYSTKYNVTNHITDRQQIEHNFFSDGFVASMVRAKQRRFLRMRNVKCGLYGTADKALDILVEYGCPQASQFDCNCEIGAADSVLKKALNYKIKNYTVVTRNFEFSQNSILKIQSCLDLQNPVITAIHQTDELYDLNKEHATLSDLNADNESANHVVCIVGYDNKLFDGSGGFLVKNNYVSWGQQGFCWIRCVDFMHLIDQSYVIEL